MNDFRADTLALAKEQEARKVTLNSVKVQTLGEICRTNFPPLQWYVYDLLPSGFSILGAPSKTGKSFFSLQLAGAIAEGAPFLGRQTLKSECLYLCLEAGERGLKARALMNRLGGLEGIHVVTDLGNANALRFIEAFHLAHLATRVVIVDVLARVRPIQPNGPMYGAEYQELTPWRELAEKLDIAILGITHTRKSLSETGDFVDELYGSGAVSGVPNGVIQLRRPRGTQRTILKATFRDARDLELVLNLDPATCLWTATDENPDTVDFSPERRKVLDALKGIPGGLTAAELRLKAGLRSASSASNIFGALKEQGLIQEVKRGRYSLPNNGEVDELSELKYTKPWATSSSSSSSPHFPERVMEPVEPEELEIF